KQVADKIWSLAAAVETWLAELPIEPARAQLFATRLRQNLTPRLGARLPVVAHACQVKHVTKQRISERWREAVATGRALTEKRAATRRSSFAARISSPLVFMSVLPITFLFPQ